MVNRVDVNRNTKRQPHWNGKNPAQIPDAAPRSRTALDPVAYDNLIKQHGVRVKVYRSMFCPNVKSVDGGEHNIDCTLCNGSGYLDVDPISSVAYLSNQNFQEEMTVEGYHDGNSVGGTFLGGVELQYFTRVDLEDFTQPFYERVLRRADSVFTLGTNATIAIDFGASGGFEGSRFSNFSGMDDFIEIISQPSALNITSVQLEVLSGSGSGLEVNTTLSLLLIKESSDIVSNLRDVYNGISRTTGTTVSTSLGDVVIRRISSATADNGTRMLSIIKDNNDLVLPVPTVLNDFNASGSFTQRQNETGTNVEDNLKYDCKRVNVIIDKTGEQYHQDIDFKLTPQGNVRWGLSNHFPTPGTIYSAHYESVIQYRAISAMHINRFAQVPDRSTGLVAQVKMPEQWMLQKEFLIIRRDEYGNEIKKTGIYGDIIANQPLNPAPADTL